MTNYKATPAQWGAIHEGVFYSDAESACILELRDRVEALEAAQRAIAQSPTNRIHLEIGDAPETTPALAGSLVERVQRVIAHSYPDDARAAIVEVAAWLREAHDWTVAPALLEQEAER